jgi:hypothetical protein
LQPWSNHNLLRSVALSKYPLYKNTGLVEMQKFFPKLSKAILDEIDTMLAQHYKFTPEELDFIVNYDIKYRMGADEA